MKEREKSNSTYKVSGLRKSGREAVIPVTDVGVRQIWKIHRIKNYIVDKSVENRGNYKAGSWIYEFELRRRYKFGSHQCIDSSFIFTLKLGR